MSQGLIAHSVENDMNPIRFTKESWKSYDIRRTSASADRVCLLKVTDPLHMKPPQRRQSSYLVDSGITMPIMYLNTQIFIGKTHFIRFSFPPVSTDIAKRWMRQRRGRKSNTKAPTPYPAGESSPGRNTGSLVKTLSHYLLRRAYW